MTVFEAMDVVGLILVLAFYGIILLAGIWVAQRRGVLHPKTAEDLMLAGRNFGLTVGIFTLVRLPFGNKCHGKVPLLVMGC